MIRTRAGSVFGTAALMVALATGQSTAQQPTGVPHTADLSAPRVDVLDGGDTVITLAASGELKGLVTFTLRRAADGSFNGEWAFTVAHVDNTDPATGVEPEPEHEHADADHEHADGDHEHHEHPHRDYVTMVHRGALAGAVSGAQLSFDSGGALAEITAALTIAQGSAEFEGATGSGQATLNALTLFF
jgi:hypothetical protein